MLLALLLMASTASAADQPTYYPPKIQAFVNCMSEVAVWPVNLPQWEAAQGPARTCIDEKVADALEAAKGKEDLRSALKTMYLKSSTFLNERGRGASEAEFREAGAAVFLETKLAGLANEAALPKPEAQ